MLTSRNLDVASRNLDVQIPEALQASPEVPAPERWLSHASTVALGTWASRAAMMSSMSQTSLGSKYFDFFVKLQTCWHDSA